MVTPTTGSDPEPHRRSSRSCTSRRSRQSSAATSSTTRVPVMTAETDEASRRGLRSPSGPGRRAGPRNRRSGHSRVGSPNVPSTISESQPYLRDFSRVVDNEETVEAIVSAPSPSCTPTASTPASSGTPRARRSKSASKPKAEPQCSAHGHMIRSSSAVRSTAELHRAATSIAGDVRSCAGNATRIAG